jgi:alpha-beta hydrolase superfamily lysophospholipase
MEFPFEVVESMLAFKANEVVGKIAPRPLLLLHAAHDSVTPTEQSIDLFQHAGQPTDLHLVADVDHFMLSEGNPLVLDLVRSWLDKYLPLPAAAR